MADPRSGAVQAQREQRHTTYWGNLFYNHLYWAVSALEFIPDRKLGGGKPRNWHAKW